MTEATSATGTQDIVGSSAKPLSGKTVAVAGGRRFTEIEALMGKLGGQACERRMMHSLPLDSVEVREALTHLYNQGSDWFVMITGMGTQAMLDLAEKQHKKAHLLQLLHDAKLAVRGYKTLNVLKKHGLTPVLQDTEGTIDDLHQKLKAYVKAGGDFSGKRITFQLHGEPMPALQTWFEAQGAWVHELPLYRYTPPSQEAVTQLAQEVVTGAVDAVAFTSSTQVSFFLAGCTDIGKRAAVVEALNHTVTPLAVGHVTRRALLEHGVHSPLTPDRERMGALIMHYAEWVAAS